MTGPIDNGDGGRPIERQCKGHKPDGSRCRRPASRGAVVCASHGAGAPQVKAAALRRVAEDQARAELARLAPEVVPVTNPLELLATLCGEARQWQEICRARRDELGSATYETPAGFELARAEIALWERAIDRVERFATSMARLDIDDRLVKIGTRITEELGTVIYLTVSGVMTDLGHDFSDELVRATCQRRLRAVAADRA